MGRDTLLRIVAVVSSSLLVAYMTLATQCFLSGLRLTTWLVANFLWTAILWGVIDWRAKLAADAARSRDRRKEKALRRQLQRLSLLSVSALLAFLVSDTLYNVALHRMGTPLPFQFEKSPSIGGLEIGLRLPRHRVGDGGRNKSFGLIGGEIYGELVPPQLVDHPQWQKEIVESRRVEYRMDEHGYRNPTGIWSQASCLAVGDSFVFGAGIDAESTWVSQLRDAGLSIYNMGESGTGPVDQWQRVQELLHTSAPETLRTIVWMFFGGNDLQGRYGSEFGEDTSQIVAGTVLVGPLRALEAIRDDSLLGRLRNGRIQRLRYPAEYWFEGALLPAPRYVNSRGEAKLFYAPYIEEAQRTEASLADDPQVAATAKVWEQLSNRATKLGWQVLLVYAPSAEHLLGDSYESFPQTEPPVVANWLEKQASERGFAYLDLSPVLKQASEKEIPYFRDDTHWNRWGHVTARRAIEEKLGELGWYDFPDSEAH